MSLPHKQGLYDPANEHDACGVGFVAHIKGEKRHEIITQGLEILKNIDQTRLKQIFALHLSDTNTSSDLVIEALENARSHAGIEITIVDQEAGLGWYSL